MTPPPAIQLFLYGATTSQVSEHWLFFLYSFITPFPKQWPADSSVWISSLSSPDFLFPVSSFAAFWQTTSATAFFTPNAFDASSLILFYCYCLLLFSAGSFSYLQNCKTWGGISIILRDFLKTFVFSKRLGTSPKMLSECRCYTCGAWRLRNSFTLFFLSSVLFFGALDPSRS